MPLPASTRLKDVKIRDSSSTDRTHGHQPCQWCEVAACFKRLRLTRVPRCCIHKSSTVLLTYRLYWPSAICKLKHEVGSESSNNEARRPAPFAHREANTTSMRRKWLTVLYRRRRSVCLFTLRVGPGSLLANAESTQRVLIDVFQRHRAGTRPPARVCCTDASVLPLMLSQLQQPQPITDCSGELDRWAKDRRRHAGVWMRSIISELRWKNSEVCYSAAEGQAIDRRCKRH